MCWVLFWRLQHGEILYQNCSKYFPFNRYCMAQVNSLSPRQNCHHFADDIFKCIFVSKNIWIHLRFHWSLFIRFELPVFQHWFRLWLDADKATSHYLNNWWFTLLTHTCVTWPQWVKIHVSDVIIPDSKFNNQLFKPLTLLTHCGLVTSDGDRDPGQHWLR